jgi:hypothetical protein
VIIAVGYVRIRANIAEFVAILVNALAYGMGAVIADVISVLVKMIGARSGVNVATFVTRMAKICVNVLTLGRVFRAACVAKTVAVFVCMRITFGSLEARAKRQSERYRNAYRDQSFYFHIIPRKVYISILPFSLAQCKPFLLNFI